MCPVAPRPKGKGKDIYNNLSGKKKDKKKKDNYDNEKPKENRS